MDIDNKEKEILLFLMKYIDNNPNIIDVGGNIGCWSEYVLSITEPSNLYIFEPENKNIEILNHKFKNNENIKVIGKGLGDVFTVKTYYDMVSENSDIRGLGGFIKRGVYSGLSYNTFDLEITTLDSFIDNNINIDFIKIDVEGFEFNVIKGMSNMLESSKFKFIQFEYGGTYLDANIKLNDVIQYLNNYGYFVYDLKEGKFNKIISYIDNYEYNNFIATKIVLDT